VWAGPGPGSGRVGSVAGADGADDVFQEATPWPRAVRCVRGSRCLAVNRIETLELSEDNSGLHPATSIACSLRTR
jgi:hypothetical protein